MSSLFMALPRILPLRGDPQPSDGHGGTETLSQRNKGSKGNHQIEPTLRAVPQRSRIGEANCYGFSRTFRTPFCCANFMALLASESGNVRVMSGRGSTSFARSRAIAFANGPQREPSMVISFTTMGQDSM